MRTRNIERARKHSRTWYEKHRQERIQETIDRRKGLAAWLNRYKRYLHCEVCGESRWQCLDFHHRIPSEKIKSISEMVHAGTGFYKLLAEIKKCQVLCANCHRVEEFSRRDYI